VQGRRGFRRARRHGVNAAFGGGGSWPMDVSDTKEMKTMNNNGIGCQTRESDTGRIGANWSLNDAK
jgi:hypothetical protein